MNNFLRKDLSNIKPYKVNDTCYEIKLDANESPYNMDQDIKIDVIEWLIKNENFNRYPDTNNTILKEAISDYWNININNLICGVGSDQLIDCIMKLFLEPNDKVLLPDPSFSMYTLTAKLNHGLPIYYKLEDDYSYNVNNIIDSVKKENPKLLFLCSPNNPTGNVISDKEIKTLLEQVKCPVIIDEAYGEFTDSTFIPYVNDYKNVIVLRTLSKAYGLAGLRVGYGIANKEFIDLISITKPPYNLNTFSQVVAAQVFNNITKYRVKIKKIKTERDWLYNKLLEINKIKCFPSEANFFLIKSEIKLDDVLIKKGILIKSLSSNKILNGCYRISVGTREQNLKLIDELRKF